MEEEKQQVVIRPPTLVEKQTKGRPDQPKQGAPVDVNSNLTPITRQEIGDVFGDQWEKMSLEQLYHQLDIMEQRLLYANSLGKEEIYRQVLLGVNQLKAIIIRKTPDEIKLI